MREIKFRVWTGMAMEYRVVVGQLGAFYVEGLDPEDSACMSRANTIYSPQTPIMQFTGMIDKNRKEIYEGDILNYTGFDYKTYRGQVEFHNGSFILRHKIGYSTFNNGGGKSDEVIGNIYENPDLLK